MVNKWLQQNLFYDNPSHIHDTWEWNITRRHIVIFKPTTIIIRNHNIPHKYLTKLVVKRLIRNRIVRINIVMLHYLKTCLNNIKSMKNISVMSYGVVYYVYWSLNMFLNESEWRTCSLVSQVHVINNNCLTVKQKLVITAPYYILICKKDYVTDGNFLCIKKLNKIIFS